MLVELRGLDGSHSQKWNRWTSRRDSQAKELAKTCEKVELNVVWHWVLRVLRGQFAHERTVMFENNILDPMVSATAILPGFKWSVLLFRIGMLDAMDRIFHSYLEEFWFMLIK